MGFDSRNAWVWTVADRVGLDSRGTRGFTQSRNAWVYTVSERVDSRGTERSRGTRGLTQAERVDLQSKNAWIYTLAERVDLHCCGHLHCRGTRGFRQSRSVGLDSRGTRGFRQSRNAWI